MTWEQSTEECGRWTEGSKKVIPKKEKNKLVEYPNVTDYVRDFQDLEKPSKKYKLLHWKEILSQYITL